MRTPAAAAVRTPCTTGVDAAALVEVGAAEEEQHPAVRRRGPARTSPRVADAGRRGEAGQVADGDRGLGRAERVGGRRPARAHDQGDVRAAAEGGGQLGGGGGGRGSRGSVPGGAAPRPRDANAAQLPQVAPVQGPAPSLRAVAGSGVPLLDSRRWRSRSGPRSAPAWASSGSCSSSTGRPASCTAGADRDPRGDPARRTPRSTPRPSTSCCSRPSRSSPASAARSPRRRPTSPARSPRSPPRPTAAAWA